MTQLDVQSIQDSVRKGTLVELSSDYRTSRTVRAYLPEQIQCAMSSTAFRQHVLGGPAGATQSRVEAICAGLGNLLELGENTSPPGTAFQVRGENGQSHSYPLRLEWFAPNKCWVVLLPEESLRAATSPVAAS